MYRPQMLPKEDAELLQMWELCGRDNKATGRMYGVGESPVRKRIRRIKGPTGRRYVRLPKPVEELYAEWLAAGTGVGSQAALARSYGVLPTTLRRAFRLYRIRNSEEEERREQEEDREAAVRGSCVRRSAGRLRPRSAEHHLPEHPAGGSVR